MSLNPQGKVRIVSLAPNVTSILLAIGAGRELVGVSKWCKDVADVGRRPQVGDCWKMNIDEVMRLGPTILIGSVPFAPDTVAKILAESVTFVAINPRSLADIERDISTLGRIANRAANAEKLILKMRSSFESVARAAQGCLTNPLRQGTAFYPELRRLAVSKRTPNPGLSTLVAEASPEISRKVGRAMRSNPAHTKHRPRVYCEAWPKPRISSPPWVRELIEIAGGRMVGAAGERVTDEEVARAKPDVIVLAWAATGGRPKPASALRNPAWQDVPAVKNRRVFVIRDELLNTPGPPLIKGAWELLRVIHGTS
jgi:ABC-type Fe3+-hydroxamate transport system substrate-binding protein